MCACVSKKHFTSRAEIFEKYQPTVIPGEEGARGVGAVLVTFYSVKLYTAFYSCLFSKKK